MAKKKDEKDVLVVRDEKTGEISVVAGLNADGTPKRTPAKAENAQSFLQFDRHGDVLDNFFKNFFRQCKEPSRFGFYRIAADQAENLLEVMKQLLKDPEANKELLAPHKVDTSDYEKKVQEEMAAQQTEKQEPQKQENMEQRKEQQQDKSEQMQPKRDIRPFDIEQYELHKFNPQDRETQKRFYPYFKSRGIDLYTQYAFHRNFCLATRHLEDGRAYTNLSFQEYTFNGDWKARYIRIKAKEANKGFIFTDEIVIW